MEKNIEEAIYSTFEELTTMYYSSNNNDTSIVFPFYADKQTIRVSEQELRICLIKNLLQNECCRISVETPTMRNYRFKGGVRVGDDCGQEKSESARIDLTLLDKTKNKCEAIIELKAHARTRTIALYQDFVKLSMEEAETKCFVMIFEDMNDKQRKHFLKKFNDCFSDEIDKNGYLKDKKNEILGMCYFHDINGDFDKINGDFDKRFSEQLKTEILNYEPDHP